MYKIKLKDLPTILYNDCDAEYCMSFVTDYIKQYKDANPDTLLKFDTPASCTTKEDQEQHIQNFYHFYAADYSRLYMADLEAAANEYNKFVKLLGKYMLNNDNHEIDLLIGEKFTMYIGEEYFDHGDEYYSTRRTLNVTHSDKHGDYGYKRVNVPNDAETLAAIHKIMVVYEYAKKKSKKLTVKLTKDSVYSLLVNVVENGFFGEVGGYYAHGKNFSKEHLTFLKQLIDSLDPEIVKAAYADADKALEKINATKAIATKNL